MIIIDTVFHRASAASRTQRRLSWLHVLSCFSQINYVVVVQSCPTLCNPMHCSTPHSLHSLLEFAQTHVHWVSDAIQPSHPLVPSSPFAFDLSQHQSLFQWVSWAVRIRWPKNWSFSICPSNEYQDWFPLGLTGLILQSKELSRVFSSTTVRKH